MNREEYRKQLNRLPIENPTQEDLRAICPHLTAEEVREAFIPNHGEKSVYVATPPLKVKYANQVVCYYQGDNKIAPILYSFGAHRTRKSYADRRSHGDAFYHMTADVEAMIYAEEHWLSDLILDTWHSFAEILVQDPTDLTNGEPRTLYKAFLVAFRSEYAIDNDHYAPASEVWNEAISLLTLDPFEGMELKGYRAAWTSYNCAYCGYGLHSHGCYNCGHRFRDNGIRTSSSTPLPPKVTALLVQNGHIFKMNPQLALDREHGHWEEVWRQKEIR